MASKSQSAERKARIEEMRRAERARERRSRIITITASAVVVAALVAGGAYLLNKESDKKEQEQAAAKAPVKDEKSWDAKKLGRNHVTEAVTYPMTPPVGGDHHQVWMNCQGDVYKEAVQDVNAVHSLEHGAVWVTYNDKASDADVKALGEKVEKTPYSFMSPVKNQAGALMLSAWGKQVTVDSATDPRVDQFFTKYVQGEQTPEPGAACTGGMGAQ
ncbi:DUF3105 domain-containing protein [Streptomyces scopuliridis]|uniref:Membrane protein n=2 Tax=Streptomyces scopuliridis TaxID=452529 RepID=A0A2T7TFJ5_9ACTN|nr:DUF3105 domain-containing protein [Streptomyces scopuliridis]PVE13934.1 membrane protein [Streptomyces scopuliridis RB72]WSB36142.1 DUF3105 domain-containing protein [Streptomyces scopuliridis]WSC00436.1 DUF3105 domain-containing protein [Streptomyces scopuliridis]WSC05952.1 DUF3105 domain-containing protein [Streptomyces scopuliridis]